MFAYTDNSFAFVLVFNDRDKFRYLSTAGQLVIAKPVVEFDAKIGVHNASLQEIHAERLNHAAVDLAFRRQTVKRKSAVLHMNHLNWANLSGFDIDFNFSKAHTMNTTFRKIRPQFTAGSDARGR